MRFSLLELDELSSEGVAGYYMIRPWCMVYRYRPCMWPTGEHDEKQSHPYAVGYDTHVQLLLVL